MALPIIITAMHGRPEITTAFCMAAKRIFNKCNVPTFAAVTRNDHDNIQLCKQYGVEYIETRNDPLGSKWNAILREVKGEFMSHVMIMGSDNIASTSFVNYQMDQDADLTGMDDLWFWGLNRKKAGYRAFGYWRSNLNKIIGVGRMISKEVLNELDWTLWDDDLRTGLDRSCLDRARSVARSVHNFNMKEEGLFAMDVKFAHNLSSLSPILRTYEPQDRVSVLMEHLPADEVEYLNYLYSNESILH